MGGALSKLGAPAHYMAVAGGIGAAAVMHGEMFGIPAFKVTAITESHSINAESMASYAGIMSEVGLAGVQNVSEKKLFRQILREAN